VKVKIASRTLPKADTGSLCFDFARFSQKTFQMLELIVRIKALLRRNIHEEDDSYQVGDSILRIEPQTLIHSNKNIELSSIEARLLKELIVNEGRTVDASALMVLIWQRDDPYSRNSLHGLIHKLRQYLSGDNRISIINPRGIGYMLTVNS